MTKVKSNVRLHLIRKYFPKVLTVSDETKTSVYVNVKEIDVKNSERGNFKECALAKACKRELKIDGVFIGLTNSYLIKGTHATRYQTTASVARELVTFDRHKDFDEGNYHLAPVPKSARLGSKDKSRGETRDLGTTQVHKVKHMTMRVRRVKR